MKIKFIAGSSLKIWSNSSELIDFPTTLVAYHGYFISLAQYGIILWGNSPDSMAICRL